jgi:riboflavin kinase/FMN adenylyltransferase
LTATEFFDELLVHQLGVSGLVEGPNFRFGKQRGGDVALLDSLCRTHGIALSIVEPEMEGAEWVSSSMIRDWVSQGCMEQANRALVTPYRIMGNVAHGAARGRTLGFPTANLVDIPILLPAHGVYAGRIVGMGSRDSMASGFPAAVNIGPNPTFGENATKVEVHILDFSGDLYGADLELEILARIRDVQKFSGKDALLEQLQMDVIAARHICSPS